MLFIKALVSGRGCDPCVYRRDREPPKRRALCARAHGLKMAPSGTKMHDARKPPFGEKG
jgi:hypothetical protein